MVGPRRDAADPKFQPEWEGSGSMKGVRKYLPSRMLYTWREKMLGGICELRAEEWFGIKMKTANERWMLGGAQSPSTTVGTTPEIRLDIVYGS